MKQFKTDNFFFKAMDKVADLVVLNVLFILTSLPIVTIGASLTSMYSVLLLKKESPISVPKAYFDAFKAEWKPGIKLGIIFIVTGAILLFDILYMENLWFLLNVAIGFIALLWIFCFSYAFPLQACYENKIGNTLKNALFLSFRYFPLTVLLAVVNCIPIFCFLGGVFVVQMAIPIYVFVGFSLSAKINAAILTGIFKKFTQLGDKTHVD